MNKLIKTASIILISLMIVSCKTTQSVHNSQNSLDWDGVYKGTSLSVTGEELITILTLKKDLTYVMQSSIVGKADVIEESGVFNWNKAGNEITLKNKTVYKVGENTLTKIEENKEKIVKEKQNIMQKLQNDVITEKYWKLIEINGKPIERPESNTGKEPYMILKMEDSKVIGSGGCNSFTGSYQMDKPHQIKFSKMAATMMACMDMEVEQQMFKMFEMVDNYTISADGKYLSLNRARMAPLARFEVVYLR